MYSSNLDIILLGTPKITVTEYKFFVFLSTVISRQEKYSFFFNTQYQRRKVGLSHSLGKIELLRRRIWVVFPWQYGTVQ